MVKGVRQTLKQITGVPNALKFRGSVKRTALAKRRASIMDGLRKLQAPKVGQFEPASGANKRNHLGVTTHSEMEEQIRNIHKSGGILHRQFCESVYEDERSYKESFGNLTSLRIIHSHSLFFSFSLRP